MFSAAEYNEAERAAGIESAGIGICENSFRLAKTAITGECSLTLRVTGKCRACGQIVGGIVIAPGLTRMNWHERRPVDVLPACPVQPDNGIPDEVF